MDRDRDRDRDSEHTLLAGVAVAVTVTAVGAVAAEVRRMEYMTFLARQKRQSHQAHLTFGGSVDSVPQGKVAAVVAAPKLAPEPYGSAPKWQSAQQEVVVARAHHR